jgi:hypothetical protein
MPQTHQIESRETSAMVGVRANSRSVAAVVASGHEQSVSIIQQLAGGHPSGRDDVRQIPVVASKRRRSLGRARDRHQPRDRPVLVEPIWPDVRRRDSQATRRAHARLSALAVASGWCVTNTFLKEGVWRHTRDEGVPGGQRSGAISNPCKLRSSRAMVVSVAAKGGTRSRQDPERRAQANR